MTQVEQVEWLESLRYTYAWALVDRALKVWNHIVIIEPKIKVPASMATDDTIEFCWNNGEHHLDIDIEDNIIEIFTRNRRTEETYFLETNILLEIPKEIFKYYVKEE